MTKNVNDDLQLSSSIPTPSYRTAKPTSEFFSIFSEEEILGIIHALEV